MAGKQNHKPPHKRNEHLQAECAEVSASVAQLKEKLRELLNRANQGTTPTTAEVDELIAIADQIEAGVGGISTQGGGPIGDDG